MRTIKMTKWWLLLGWVLFCRPPVVGQTVSRIQATRIATGLNRPVYLTTAPGDSQRLFVLEQHTGRIRIVDRSTGQLHDQPFLDLSGLSTGGEQGLLGLAFDPAYAETGQFYVNFTDDNGRTNVVRYRVGADPNLADAASGETILRVSQPQSNHNAGWLDFGPQDGYLYVALGDGGGANDTGSGHTNGIGNGQDVTDNLLGKLLRIDVSSDDFPQDATRNYAIPPSNPFVGANGDNEIWAYGLRNPWRNSFDRTTGDLWIADVGQGSREEINFQSAGSAGGENYGWRLREGDIATPGVGGPVPADYVGPIYDYPHDDSAWGGGSVTGGYVYRGPIAELQGQYFFADFVSDQIWSLRYDASSGEVSDLQVQTQQILADEGELSNISSFGEDADGNLYLMSLSGDIFRLSLAGDFNDNGQLDADDIDTLTTEIQAGGPDPRFDLNDDSIVNLDDRAFWIEQLKQTWLGDSNLDGEFSSSDLVLTLQAGQYEDAVPDNATWASGDWNGDQEFTSEDLIAAMVAGGYEQGPRVALRSVPEPSSLCHLLLYVASVVWRWRRPSSP